jgi:hypothetical protein
MLGRFYNKLVELDQWGSLLEEINSRLASQNIIMAQARIKSLMQRLLRLHNQAPVM